MPPYPIAGKKVATEIKSKCPTKEDCPYFWAWMAKLKKFKDQIDLLR